MLFSNKYFYAIFITEKYLVVVVVVVTLPLNFFKENQKYKVLKRKEATDDMTS